MSAKKDDQQRKQTEADKIVVGIREAVGAVADRVEKNSSTIIEIVKAMNPPTPPKRSLVEVDLLDALQAIRDAKSAREKNKEIDRITEELANGQFN
jgi:hypothetical protein